MQGFDFFIYIYQKTNSIMNEINIILLNAKNGLFISFYILYFSFISFLHTILRLFFRFSFPFKLPCIIYTKFTTKYLITCPYSINTTFSTNLLSFSFCLTYYNMCFYMLFIFIIHIINWLKRRNFYITWSYSYSNFTNILLQCLFDPFTT